MLLTVCDLLRFIAVYSRCNVNSIESISTRLRDYWFPDTFTDLLFLLLLLECPVLLYEGFRSTIPGFDALETLPALIEFCSFKMISFVFFSSSLGSSGLCLGSFLT